MFVGLTPAMLQVLQDLDQAEREERYEDAEIVCSGIECWLGDRHVSCRTVKSLLKLMALSFDDMGGANHYTLNDTGRELSKHPELTEKIRAAIARGKPFQIVDGKVKRL